MIVVIIGEINSFIGQDDRFFIESMNKSFNRNTLTDILLSKTTHTFLFVDI
jgi:hypothetical protein